MTLLPSANPILNTFWETAAHAWHNFLVEAEKSQVDFAGDIAWYRGQSQPHKVRPSLFRCEPLFIPDQRLKELRNEFKAFEAERSLIRNDRQPSPRLVARREELESLIRDKAVAIKSHSKTLWSYDHVLDAEQRAFSLFSVKRAAVQRNSWEVLAEMRHAGVRTRLLDWSESLGVAAFFALKWYREKLAAGRASDPKFDGKLDRIRTVKEFFAFLEPPKQTARMYILDPLALASSATGRPQIYDLTRIPKLDYYDNFISSQSWPHSLPLPLVSPWTTPRIASQQGTFTVQGQATNELDSLLPPSILRTIPIPHQAAIYGVRMFEVLFNIDEYALMQDNDSLGRQINARCFAGV